MLVNWLLPSGQVRDRVWEFHGRGNPLSWRRRDFGSGRRLSGRPGYSLTQQRALATGRGVAGSVSV